MRFVRDAVITIAVLLIVAVVRDHVDGRSDLLGDAEQVLNLVAQLVVPGHLRVELIEKRIDVLIRQRLRHRAKNLHLLRRPILSEGSY